ncbi:MAG: ergot alkaloid biosynthesis protein [Pigmentiphaga sp.]
MADRVLVTGAKGKTGSSLVHQLREAGVAVWAGTRSPKVEGDVAFDWHKPETFDAALDGVTGVYLVAPTDTDMPLQPMKPFLERAASLRLVLLSASSLPQGGPMMGAIHEWLATNAPNFAVLRPTWFMQNIMTQHLHGILKEDAIFSATEDGRIPFIDARDIAAVAAAMLAGALSEPGAAPILTGPQAWSYDDVAEMLTKIRGRRVRHVRLSVADLARRYETYGLPPSYATTLAAFDSDIAKGSEDRVTNEVAHWTHQQPNNLLTFLAAHEAILRG